MKKSSIVYGAVALSVSIVLLVLWITRKPDSLETALKLAGSNRTELEKVLEHYRKSEADSLKLKAAGFLISNMPGHFSYDSTALVVYRPILHLYDSLCQHKKTYPSFDYRDQLNENWNELKSKYDLYENIYNKPVKFDIENISAPFLISQIDQAFTAWDSAKQIIEIDFQTFCKYVLPYRRQKGVCVEDWRTHFKNDKIKINNRPSDLPIECIVDSILYQYSEFAPKGLKHAVTDLSGYPYLKVSDVCISKRVICETRCWFNSMLLASLGLPVSIDYVPAWGNRDNSHAWNVIFTNKGSRAFESFWDWERWKYKRIYNNRNDDTLWGRFRLPKVYRYSYVSLNDGPLSDRSVPVEDIPPFFRNMKQEDVSSEYFELSDVNVEIENAMPNGSKYLWLCVFNSGQWKPVHWAKIKDKSACFIGMGRDIAYLPAFYKDGEIIPAAPIMLLQQDGVCRKLKPLLKKEVQTLYRKFPTSPKMYYSAKQLIGSKIQVSNHSTFADSKTILEIKSVPDLFTTRISLPKGNMYRYIRFIFSELLQKPVSTDGFPCQDPRYLAEFEICESQNELLVGLHGKPVFSNGFDSLEVKKCFDNDVLTFCRPKFESYADLRKCSCWLGLDLKKTCNINMVGFCPLNDKNNIYPGLRYELIYWDDKWVSLGEKMATGNFLVYDNVPSNALLLLHCLNEGKAERPFLFEGGKQDWR